MKKLLLIIVLSVVLISGFILSGCAKQTTTPTKPAPASTTTASAPAPKKGGILKVAMGGDAQRLGDPQETKMEGAFMQRAAIEYMGRFDSTVTLQPYLAESWQGDAAAKTFTIKLKKGIKFQDGTDFNAAAVKWNWERFMAAKSTYTKRVTSIDAVDDYTVRVNLDTWDADIATNLCYWAGGMVSPTAWKTNGDTWGEKNPIGTGPFKFVSWVRDTKVTFTKFDGYWQKGKPYLDGVEFDIIADATVSEASFKAGDVDATMMIQPLNAKNLTQENKYVIDNCGGIGAMWHSLYTDGGKAGSIFADAKIRKALGYAIDRQKITNNVLLGYGKPTNQKALPGDWGYNTNMEGQTYNPTKAKQMLTEAGYPNGFKTTITVMAPFSSYMEAAQPMLKEVGIDVQLNVLAPDGWRHLFEVGWDGILHCIEPPGAESGQKFGMYTIEVPFGPCIPRPPEVEAMQVAIRASTDFATEQKLVWQGQAKVFDELALGTPLWVQPGLAATYPYVHNDGFMKAAVHESTLENCWIDK